MSNYKGKRLHTWTKILAGLVLAGALTFGGLLTAVVLGDRDELRGEPQAMVILGCQVMEWGPSILLQDRLEEALDYLQEHPQLVVVVSGGQGDNEPTTEARAMADYLMERGVAQEQILLEDRSHNTRENLLYSKSVLDEAGIDGDVVVVSNGFHLARVRMLWGRLYGDDAQLSTLAAPSTHAPSRMSMYVREPLALAKSILLDHF